MIFRALFSFFPALLVKTFRRNSICWLARTLPCATLGLALTSACVSTRTSGSTNQAPVLVDAALAEDILACAEEQYKTAGYATHRDVRTPRAVQAEREGSGSGSGYELNVTGAALRPVDGNSKALRLAVWAETRAFQSRDLNSGYEIRSTARAEVQQVARSVMARCAMN
jgi:hypothetical protein